MFVDLCFKNKKIMMAKKLSLNEKVSYFKTRKQPGDITNVADDTGYSVSHVSNIVAGRRNVNEVIGNALYDTAKGRKATSLRW